MNLKKCIIAQFPDKPGCSDMSIRIYVAVCLHLWDAMSMDDRKDWSEKGILYDTYCGRAILEAIDTL